MGRSGVIAAIVLLLLALFPAGAFAQSVGALGIDSHHPFDGSKLLLTNGVTTIEGSAGGGLASWAAIPGMETDHGIGVSAFATGLALNDFRLESHGFAVGIRDRLGLSYARQNFNTRSAGAALGLGQGYTFHQDIVAARVRVLGDVIYGPALLPQITIGVDFKHNLNGAIVRAVGAKQSAGTDFIISATKMMLGSSVLIDTTLRWTKANQFGLLGFGGDRNATRKVTFEGSLGYQFSRHLVIGGELRTRPDNLGFAHEAAAHDLFVAWAPQRHVTITAAFVDVGPVATFRRQRGAYLSLQFAA